MRKYWIQITRRGQLANQESVELAMEGGAWQEITWGFEGWSWAMRSHGDRLSSQGSRAGQEVPDAATEPAWDSWAGGGWGSSNRGSAGAEAEPSSRREAHLRIRMGRRRGGGSWGSGVRELARV